jgi:outer membrane protein
MKKFLLFIIASCQLSTANCQLTHQWTLDECMDYAIAHNVEIRHLQHEQQRRQINVQSSKDARLPRFNGEVGGYFRTLHSGDGDRFDANASLLDMGLMGAVPLYTGSRLSSQIKANKYSLMAASEDVRSAGKDIKIQVAAAYLQLLYYKGEVLIAQQRQEVSQLLLQQANSLFDKGQRPKSDVVEAQAMVSRDEALLTAAEGEVAMAKLDLQLLLNLPDSVDFDICELADSLSHLSPPTSHLSTLTSQLSSLNHQLSTSTFHPAVQSANYSILQAEQGVKMARSGYFPTLSLVGELGTSWTNLDGKISHSGQIPLTSLGIAKNLSYKFNYEPEWKRKNFLYSFVGLRLSIPVFNAFETRARIRTAKVNLEDAKLAYDDAQQQVRKEIRQAWQSAVTAQKRYEAEAKSEEANALSYRYALKRYDAGMATLFDLSQSHQQWFAASENTLRQKYEYIIRKKILEILTEQ